MSNDYSCSQEDLMRRDELMAVFIEYRAQGKTIQECAKVLNKPLGTLGHWNVNCRSQINDRRKEHLARTFGLTQADQLTTLKTVNHKLTAALGQVDFNALSPKDLFTVLFKVLGEQNHQLNQPGY